MRWGMESTGQVKGLEDDRRNGKRLAIRGSFGKTSKGLENLRSWDCRCGMT